jgi:hypothetical protein
MQGMDILAEKCQEGYGLVLAKEAQWTRRLLQLFKSAPEVIVKRVVERQKKVWRSITAN